MMDQIPLQINITNEEHKNFVSAFNNDEIQPEPSSSNIFCNGNDVTYNYTNDLFLHEGY